MNREFIAEFIAAMAMAVVELLKVKSIITLVIVFTLCWLAVNSQIDPATFMTVAGAVVTYYFQKK